MSKKNTDHVAMLNGGTFRCLHCFAKQDMAMPCDMDVYAAACKAFGKKHASCKAPKDPRCTFCFSPHHPSDGHVSAMCPLVEQWPSCGDTGLSSNAIFTHFMGGHRYAVGSHDRFTAPLDPSDFGRCFRLLSAPWASEWRARIAEMAQYPKWAKLAPAWDELEALYVLELQNKNGMAPKLYARMRELRT